ncbi:Hypothetical predicted protein [Octopus vulgaris]|uniref:Uncharacterized protein n=1 Tax=Octopus vulgaris TaxID=6645 RepID=A0AA36AKD0_OCTVU|nr:Hypothetical predicted protein [Octopus vulgaris]
MKQSGQLKMNIWISYKLSNMFEDLEEKPECKARCKEFIPQIGKIRICYFDSRLGRSYGTDVFEDYLLLASLFSFVKELRENSVNRIAHYATVANGLSEYITSNCSDVSKRIVTKKFADGTSDKASLKGAEKFRIEVLNQVYDCLIIHLSKWMDPYEQTAKKFKFLSELMNNSKFVENSIKLIISHYKDNIDHKLINECYQFKANLHLRKSQNRRKHTI